MVQCNKGFANSLGKISIRCKKWRCFTRGSTLRTGPFIPQRSAIFVSFKLPKSTSVDEHWPFSEVLSKIVEDFRVSWEILFLKTNSLSKGEMYGKSQKKGSALLGLLQDAAILCYIYMVFRYLLRY